MWYMLVPAPHLAELFHPRLVDDIDVLHGQVLHLLDPERAARRDHECVVVVGHLHVVLYTPMGGA